MDSTPTNVCYLALATVINAAKQEPTLQSIFITHFGVTGFLLALLLFAGLFIRHLQGRIALKEEESNVSEALVRLYESQKQFSEERRAAAERELRALKAQHQHAVTTKTSGASFREAFLRYILLVEDEKAIHQYKPEIEAALARTEVRLANNGAEAWLKIRETAPCMIIMDLAMPVMDGYELLERFAPEYLDIPVLVVSGYVRNPQEIRERIVAELPPFEFLPKPFVLADLVGAIHKLTDNKLRRDEELLRVA